MRIGPKSELMMGGLRTSPALRDFPHGSRDSWQHLRALRRLSACSGGAFM